MVVYYGKDLNTFMESARDIGLDKRDCYTELRSYLNSGNNGKVCCLYGLRRTGKTVLMLQSIRELYKKEKCLYILCEDGDFEYETMSGLRRVIDSYSDCKYIFVDEITKLHNFIDTSSVLADKYVYSGKKVVISGTDSLGFWLAKHNELYDRVQLIHTTYIPYKEYYRLLGKGIKDYIEYGGTLSGDGVFYNEDTLNEYTNTAIVYNILHSLENYQQGRCYGVLDSVVAHYDLASFLNKVIELNNRTFLAKTMNSSFKSHDFGSLLNLLEKHNIAENICYMEELNDRIRIFLGIKEKSFADIDYECVEAVIEYLKVLDVLYEVERDKEYIFLQPGLRYCQASQLLDALMTSDIFGNLSDAVKYQITQKVQSDISGRILEDIIYYSCIRELGNEHVKIRKYKNINGQEVDVLIEDFLAGKVYLIEVKYSMEQNVEQLKHICNQDVLNDIERMTGLEIGDKIVVYRGTSSYDLVNGVYYLNAGRFLCDMCTLIGNLNSEMFTTVYCLEDLKYGD